MELIEKARVTFLGTGTSQGVPMIGCDCSVCTSSDSKDNRLRSSALLEINGLTIVIDAGPDFRQQLLRAKVKRIDAVLLTHEHKDHTGGLDDIRAFNYLTRKAVPVYCEQRVAESLKREYSYAFSEHKYPGAPEFDIRIIDETPFNIESLIDKSKNVEIIPLRAYHYKLPVLGFRIGDIGYITDANRIEDNTFLKLKALNVFVINTVRREKHISHFSLSEAIDVIKRVDAKSSYLTHLSHQIGTHKELTESLPKNVYAAYDTLIVEG
jgi:phosphoribosyl 1,2-cyclic phosphate phosphodiesterase